MTEPDPTPPSGPTWLGPADVVAWLKLTPTARDDEVLARVCAAVEPQVQAARPDLWWPPRDSRQFRTSEHGSEHGSEPGQGQFYRPDGEVYLAAIMLAARVFRRRNSPGGMETSFDQIAYVARFDPEIERALQQGRSRRPAIG